MKKQIFPRIYYSAFCSALALAVMVLLGSTAVLGQTHPQGQETPAAAAPSQFGPSQRVQLEGQIEIIHQDFKDGHGRYLYFLKQADGTRVPLQFVKHPPTHFLTGDHVQVSGQMSGGNLVLYSGNANVQKNGGGGGGGTPPIPLPNTFGAQSTLVILVNFQDDVVEPYTASDAQNMVFGTSNSFFMENSYQQTSLNGSVVGWYTLPLSVSSCDLSQIATYAQNAATAAGVNLSSYTRYMYFFPQDNACLFAGASNVGGNPSQSWINGNSLNIHVIDHELGHAFGLWHSHFLDCGTAATICSNGTVVEYGDLMDTMGAVETWSPDYNAFQKERLGWLNYGASPSIQTVSTSGTYTIYPYEIGGSGPNALKVLQSTDPTSGAKTWYYLESRQAIGFDAFLTSPTFPYNQTITTGVDFHLGADGDGNSSELLDMTPATRTAQQYWDFSLAIGQSFQDSTAGVTFTPTSVTSSGAAVQVTFGSCIAANPTVSISPSQSQYVTSGTPVNFTVTVTDNDTSSCAPATFNLANTVPSGWAGVWSATSLSLSPGKSGSATLTVTSPVGTADGTYNVGASAVNASANAYIGTAAATYVINTAPLSMSLITDQSSYLPGQTVTVTVTLLYGALPDVGASVTVTITPPKGRPTNLSGTTASNGVASFTYKLGKNAPIGTYQVYGTTPAPGNAPMMGAGTSFAVQ